ncbi:MAG: hypothetical protein GXO83_03520 [Chlorobi bacterium]|nr:hypothetical protein [Chlorobiota bacterium]
MKVPEKIVPPFIRRIKKIRFDRNFFVFLFFLVLASIFWFFNQLSKDTQAVISYPVRYEITFPDQILVNKLPGKLKFSLKGDGYTLLKYIIQPKINPIVLNVQSYPLRPLPGEDEGTYYLLTSYIRGAVSDQLSPELNLIGISPDTLVFVFDSIVRKKLPLIPDIQLNLTRQVMLKEPMKLTPDSIMVTGPGRVLDTLDQVKTVSLRFDEVEKPFHKEIALRAMNDVSVNPRKVSLDVEVEQFTEASVEIPLAAWNVPDSLVLKTFPSKVTVLFHVVLSRYNQIGPELFDAGVDFNNISSSGTGKIRVELRRIPENIESVRINPARVDYLIEKKP